MGEVIETPVSELFAGGGKAISKHFRDKGPLLLFTWLCLIYIKTHLKDRFLRKNRDFRKEYEKLSTYITWEELHHIHCIARSFYTGIALEPSAFGTIITLPLLTEPFYEHFDYADMFYFSTILVRIEDVAIISVLNDACAVLNIVQPIIEKIGGPLSRLQLRELYARVAFGNTIIKERPEFYTTLDDDGYSLVIKANHPLKVEVDDYDPTAFGTLMYGACKDILAGTANFDSTVDENIKSGHFTYLVNDDGSFKKNSLVWLEQKDHQH